MSALQTSLKPLVLAIAVASSQTHAVLCLQDFTVTNSTELDNALDTIIACGADDGPYSIELADSLSGNSVSSVNPRVLDSIDLKITGPESADVSLIIPTNESANFSVYESGHLTLKNLIIDGDSTLALKRGTSGIHLESGQLDLDNVVMQNFYTTVDGAIESDGATTISNSTFKDNYTTQGGSVINATSGSELTITDSVFEDNTSNLSGGAINAVNSNLNIIGSSFTNNKTNSSTGKGGAIYLDKTPLTIADTVFEDNTATGDSSNSQGGAIAAHYESGTEYPVTIEGSTFKNNIANNKGGAISYQYPMGALTISDTVFENNAVNVHATESNGVAQGGAIYVTATNQTTLSNVQFIGNSSQNSGGALYVQGINTGKTVSISDSSFEGNTATLKNGYGQSGSGAAIFINTENNSPAALNIARSLIDNNTAEGYGGAVYFAGSSLTDSVLSITNSTLSNNTAKYGAGISYTGGYGAGTQIKHSTIVNNTATEENYGSALQSSGVTSSEDIEIEHTVISNNTGGSRQVCSNEANYYFSYKHSFVSNDDQSATDCRPNIKDNDSSVGSTAETLDPMLESLTDNGGATKTYYPKIGSPLIDAGNANISNVPDTDQRGNDRIMRGAIDIGAVEYGNLAPTLTDLVFEDPALTNGDEINLDISIYFTDQEGDSLTFSATGLPLGTSISDKGIISGKINDSGEFNITLNAEDAYGTYAEAEITLNIAVLPVNKSDDLLGSINSSWLSLLALLSVFRFRRTTNKH